MKVQQHYRAQSLVAAYEAVGSPGALAPEIHSAAADTAAAVPAGVG